MVVNNKADILESELPEIIMEIARKHNIREFIDNPDLAEKRLEKWHQFGLLAHTKKVREAFLNESNSLMKKWSLYEKIEKLLSEKIEGSKKKVLLELSVPLHDLGKIVCFNNLKTNREHEIASRHLVYESFLHKKLLSLGLSENQIGYIARCIETHDIIGKELRDLLKHENNLSLNFILNSDITAKCKAIAAKYESIKTEIGLYFLCDSLGKTDIRIDANTDEEILMQETAILDILKKRGLLSELKNAIMQLPVNIKLAESYLKHVSCIA